MAEIDYDNINYLAKKLAQSEPSWKQRDFQQFMDRVNNGPGRGYPTQTTELLNSYERELRRLQRAVEANGYLASEAVYCRKVIEQVTSFNYREGWSRWEPIGGQTIPGRRLFSDISSIANADGRLEVFGIPLKDGPIYNCWQETPNGRWHDWCSMENDFLIKEVTAARNKDGRLVVFALGDDKAIYNRWQNEPGGSWGKWGCEGGQFQSGVTVGYNEDERIELFALGVQGDIQAKWQHQPNEGFSDWYSHGGDFHKGTRTKPVTVEQNGNGALEIFASGEKDGRVYHKWQQPGGWSDWSCLGFGLGVSVGRHPDGRLEIFASGLDDVVGHRWHENQPNGRTWHDWENFGDFDIRGSETVRDREGISVFVSSLYMNKATTANHIWNRRCTSRGWSDWRLLSLECINFHVTKTKDGKDALFAVNNFQTQYSHQL